MDRLYTGITLEQAIIYIKILLSTAAVRSKESRDTALAPETLIWIAY